MNPPALAALLVLVLGGSGLAAAPLSATSSVPAWEARSVTAGRPEKTNLWIVPIRWTDGTSISPDRLSTTVEDAANFFRTDSNGRLDIVARTLPVETADRSCNPPVVSMSREVAKRNKSIDKEDDVVVLAFPPASGCGSVSYAGDAGFSWKVVACWDESDDAHCLKHGLGHALFNLHHDNLITCEGSGRPVSYGGSCVLEESANPYTIMGNGSGGGGLSAIDLISEGLRPRTAAVFAATSRQLHLSPRSSPSGTTAVIVPLLNRGGGAGGARSQLQLEYRTASGTDSWLGNPAISPNPGTGVLVSLQGDSPYAELDRHPDGEYAFGDPLDRGLLNMHPESPNFRPGMQSGDSWAAPDGSVAISVVSLSPDTATVRIDHAQDTTAPYPFKLRRPSTFSLGQKSRVFIGFDTPGDNVAVRRFRVEITGRKPFYIAADKAVRSVSQGQVTRVLPRGRYRVRVVAEDYSGNRTSSNQRRVVVR